MCRLSLSLSLSFLCVRTYELLAYGRKGRGMRAFCHASSTDRPPLSYFRCLCTQICLLAFVRRQREAVSTSPCPGKTSVKPGPWLAWARARRPSKGRGRPSPSSRKWRTVAPEPATFAPSNSRNRNKKSGRATTAFVITLEKYVFFHLLPRQ